MIDVRCLITVEDIDALLCDDEQLLSNRVEWFKANYKSIKDPDAIERLCDRLVHIPERCQQWMTISGNEELNECMIKTIALDPGRLLEI